MPRSIHDRSRRGRDPRGSRSTGLVSVEDYLKAELESFNKHEYLGGHVYAMSGGRNRHNLVAGNADLFFKGLAVLPERLIQSGFTFHAPTLWDSLVHQLAPRQTAERQ